MLALLKKINYIEDYPYPIPYCKGKDYTLNSLPSSRIKRQKLKLQYLTSGNPPHLPLHHNKAACRSAAQVQEYYPGHASYCPDKRTIARQPGNHPGDRPGSLNAVKRALWYMQGMFNKALMRGGQSEKTLEKEIILTGIIQIWILSRMKLQASYKVVARIVARDVLDAKKALSLFS